MPKPLAYTVTNAAIALGISRSEIYWLLARNELSAKKAAGHVTLILASSIEAYLASLPDFVSTRGTAAKQRQQRLRAV